MLIVVMKFLCGVFLFMWFVDLVFNVIGIKRVLLDKKKSLFFIGLVLDSNMDVF